MSLHPIRWAQSWWWNKLHPEWDEPPRDETTPEVIAGWIGRHRHPDACRGGCQCERGEGVT